MHFIGFATEKIVVEDNQFSDTLPIAVVQTVEADQVGVDVVTIGRDRSHLADMVEVSAGAHFFNSSAMVANCSSAASRSSVISWAMISGGGRLADSSSASSFSQKMSRFTLSRLSSSS